MNRFSKAVYVIGILAEIMLRIPHERRRRQSKMTVNQVTGLERSLVGLLFTGMIFLPAIYVFTPWLNWANYRLAPKTSVKAGGVGTIILAIAVWIFWRSHTDLGRNWSPTLQIREEHALVTTGIYQHVRHPMYASQWLWGIAQMLLLHNWIAGWAGLILFLPLYFVRVPREEQMMLEQFGEAYRAYTKQTGRVVPRLVR